MTELSDKEYRKLPAESFSSLKYILESPQAFIYYKQKPFTGNDSSLLGTAVHNYLQGNRHLVAINTINRLTKAGKEEYAKFIEEFLEISGEDGIVVPKAFEEKLNAIMTNYNSNEQAVKIVTECEYEKPYFFDVNGLNLKGKVDGVHPSYLLEIKTSSQATTANEFRQAAKDMHYDMQAAMYLHGHEVATGNKVDHYFVVVNTIAPFKVSVYKSSPEFLKEGQAKLYDAVDRYKRYIVCGEVYEEGIEWL